MPWVILHNKMLSAGARDLRSEIRCPSTGDLQNLVMYSFGVVIALSAYAFGALSPPAEGAPPPLGFFEGYHVLGIMLVLSQALQGIVCAPCLGRSEAAAAVGRRAPCGALPDGSLSV